MLIKKYSQMSENFNPGHDIITNVPVDIYNLPKDREVNNATAKIYWNVKTAIYKDRFTFDINLSKVEVECNWVTLDDDGETINEEPKTFTYTSEEVKGGQPDKDQLQYDISPSNLEIYLNGDKQEVEVYW